MGKSTISMAIFNSNLCLAHCSENHPPQSVVSASPLECPEIFSPNFSKTGDQMG
jgi:hypothetical protein